MRIGLYQFYKRDNFAFSVWQPTEEERGYWFIFKWQIAFGFLGIYRWLNEKETAERSKKLKKQ